MHFNSQRKQDLCFRFIDDSLLELLSNYGFMRQISLWKASILLTLYKNPLWVVKLAFYSLSLQFVIGKYLFLLFYLCKQYLLFSYMLITMKTNGRIASIYLYLKLDMTKEMINIFFIMLWHFWVIFFTLLAMQDFWLSIYLNSDCTSYNDVYFTCLNWLHKLHYGLHPAWFFWRCFCNS